jgi:hypothetical protein
MSEKKNQPPNLESAVHADLIKSYINAMKDFCIRNDIPWPLDSELHSAVDLAEGCLQKMITCMVFVQDLLRLEYYFREKEKTKAMLLLSLYGNKEELMQKVNSAIEELKEEEEHFKDRSEDIGKAILSPDYDCTDCQGTGSLERQEVFRERGSPPQLIFRTSPCNTCGGRGKIQIGMELRKNLRMFSEKMTLTLNLMSNDLKLIASLPTPSGQNL